MADVNLTLAQDTTSSASCSTSHSPDHTNSYVYQVFINHRGPDVKKGLASHIYYRLKALGVAAFLDQRELQEGENMTPQIEGAIRTASVQIAIFSPTYAESSWCLKELVLMLESGATIIPIFYHVSPGELKRTQGRDGVYARLLSILQCIFLCARDESGGYVRALRMLEKKPRHDSDTIKKWKDALFSVAEISGFELNACNGGDEGQLVEEVVQKVLQEVRRPPLDVAKYPTGLAENVKGLDDVIAAAKGEPRIVAIMGPGGIGKTTVAKEFFNSARAKYNKCCFLFDVRSKSLDSLQSSLLQDFGVLNVQINNIHEGKVKIKMHLSSSHQALVVLDDVDHIDQLDALLFPVKDVIHPKSLILVTSRNKDVLTSSGIISSLYTMKGLSPQHSRELFCLHAFGNPHSVVGFVELVEKFLKVCNGLPLSLTVLGALLRGEDDLEHWNEQLLKTSKILHSDIQRTLKISYDALDAEEKQIFLDIACFFIGEDKDTAITVWNESGWLGRSGCWKLENRCLVEVDSKNCLRMHDHIRDLGRDMAKDSKYPRRLWKLTEDDLYNMSEQSSVRGISMVHGNVPDQSFESLSDSCNLSNLRILRAEGYSVERVLSGELPRLIYLRWENCLSSSLPLSLPTKNLRVLHIKGRNLKTLWQHESQAPLQLRKLYIDGPLSVVPESIGALKHLEEFFLSRSDHKSLPNEFCNMHSLKHVRFNFCRKMTLLPQSIGNLTRLHILELHGCYTLQVLPDSVGNLTGLQSLDLRNCFTLQALPDSVGNLTGLQSLDLSGCSTLQALPDSVGNLTGLQSLVLSGCSTLQALPDSVGNLTGLQSLDLRRCSTLQALPDSVGNLTGLQSLGLSRCSTLQALPDSVGNLTGLQSLSLVRCSTLQALPDSVGNLTGLQSLHLGWCSTLQALPDSVGNLTGLQSLDLSGCSTLQALQDSVGNLTGLQSFDLSRCSTLQALPDSVGNLTGLQSLDLSGCSTLQVLPDSVGNLTGLQSLNLYKCSTLQGLPDSVGNLTGLQGLHLGGCSTLQALPNSVGNLTGLQILGLVECSTLQALPDLVGNLTGLQSLNLGYCSTLQALPDSVGNLTGLQSLHLAWCSTLQALPDSVGNLTGVQSLNLYNCSTLQALPESVGNLTGLQSLDLRWCSSLQGLPDSVGNLTGLQRLLLTECSKLQMLPNVEHLSSLELLDVCGCSKLQWSKGVVEQLRRRLGKGFVITLTKKRKQAKKASKI